MLEGGALSAKSFPAFAEKVVPFLHVTTRIKDRPYDGLLKEKGGTGFPTLMFLDPEGRTLLEHEGPRSISGFEDSLKKASETMALVRKADEGDPEAGLKVLLLGMERGWYSYDEARARADKLKKIKPSEKKDLEQRLIDLEVRTVLADAGEDYGKRIAAGERFAEMLKKKRVPVNEAERDSFWLVMADYAENEHDLKLFKKILEGYEKTMPSDDKHAQGSLKSLQLRLESFPKR